MIPERFSERMKELLSEEYAAFESALSEKSVRGVRVNTAKIAVEDYLGVTELELSPIPYADYGFIPRDCEGVGTLAEHHAGMIYVQDPGAMATVTALEVKRGWKVLDACAAPGGKASQLAALIGEEGFVLANEYVPKRAKIIVGNFERLGIRNAVVTSLDTAKLAEMFSSYFDLVLCDAPCSGEGMFRKYDEAITEWSEENVALCAERQREILANCAGTVKAGGYLLYSTCTYSKEENEDTVSAFLETHPEFSLVPASDRLTGFTAPGLCGMRDARRFYPHIAPGEGQFIALMKKDEKSGNLPTILYKETTKAPLKDEIRVVEKFLSDTFSKKPSGRLIKSGEQIILVSHALPIPSFSVFMSGVLIGEIRKGILFPHHQLFSAYGSDMKLKVNLKNGDGRVAKYLRGEEIDTDVNDSGWCAVCYEGVALGGGKISSGRVKNHYPKGLRNNK